MKSKSITITTVVRNELTYSLKYLELLVLPVQDCSVLLWLSPQSQQREASAAPEEPLPGSYTSFDYNRIPVFAEHLQCLQEGSLAYSKGETIQVHTSWSKQLVSSCTADLHYKNTSG